MTVACEVCGGEAPWWAAIEGPGGRPYDHYRCRCCRHVFVKPRPSRSELEQAYRDASFYDDAEKDAALRQRESARRLEVLAALAARDGLQRRLLDVGAASGIFLEHAIGGGWRGEGVEMSPQLAARARDKGLDIIEGLIEEVGLVKRYPVVTAWEVIEHAADPARVLAALVRAVEPGGLLALSTPLASGLAARLLGRRFPMLCPPFHLSLFSRRSLELLAARFGLERLRYRSFSNLEREHLERGYARFVFGRLPLGERRIARLSKAAALVTSWAPPLVDRAGLGSEMEVVFRRAA